MTTVLNGRYQLQERITSTARGEQYLAQDNKLGRLVLLHLLPPSPPAARWARIRQLTTLRQTHLAQIYDFKLGEGDVPLVVTEPVAPQPIEALPLPFALPQFAQLAAGLAVAHENGLTHGAISPHSLRYTPQKNSLLWADWPLTSPEPEASPVADVRQLVAVLRHTAVSLPPPLADQLDALLAQATPTAAALAHTLRTAVLPDPDPELEQDPPPATETEDEPEETEEPLPPPRLALRLSNLLLTLTPGEATVTTAVLVNEANIVLHVTPRLLGLPASWLTFDPPLLQLLPQEEAELRLTITPPRRSEARAGQYGFEWQVLSVEHEGQVATTAVGQAVMRPFVQVATSALQPSQLKNHGRVAFTLHNQSNRALTGQITGVDQSGQLLFTGVPTSYTLEPDEKQTCTLSVQPRHRPLLGTSERLPFELHLTAEEDDLPPLTGQLDNRPYLPLWALPLASLLLLFGCMAGFFLYTSAQNRAVAAAAQAEARRNEQNVAATLTRSALEIILVQTPPTPTFSPPTLIPTLTPRLVFTPTPSHTPTLTPTVPPDTATPTLTPSPSLTPSATPLLTGTVTLTPTVTLTVTVTATPEITTTPALTLTTTPGMTVTPAITGTVPVTVTPAITGTVPVTVTPTLDGVEAARPVGTAVLLHARAAESVILSFKFDFNGQVRTAKRFALRALQA